MTEIQPTDLEAAAHALIRARKTNLGIEVSMPVVYPNGQFVTVMVTVDGGEYLVHDGGFGAMYLTSAGVKLTRELTQRLVNLAGHYGCEFIEGRMFRRAAAEQLALAIAVVANASRTVGDQALELRRHTEADFRFAVRERLRSVVGKRLREDEMVPGESGRKYRVANIILDTTESRPVAFVASLPNRNLVPAQFAEFFDLKQLHKDVSNESIFDDSERFRPEDRRLLERVAELVPFSQAERRFAQFR